jgi:uncharacterized coiled-coil protein SlyX
MSSASSQPDPAARVSAARVLELEEKLMFSQRALDDLNEVVLRQHSELDQLRSEVQSLRTMVERAIDLAGGVNPPQEKPPHY